MKVTLDTKDIKNMNIFQKMTGSHVIDSINNEKIYFLVEQGHYGLAVGKSGKKIKNVEKKLNKKIKIFEYSPQLEPFIKNLIPPAKDIQIKDSKVFVNISNKDKAKVIGKNGVNIKIIKKFLKRQFDIEDVKIK